MVIKGGYMINSNIMNLVLIICTALNLSMLFYTINKNNNKLTNSFLIYNFINFLLVISILIYININNLNIQLFLLIIQKFFYSITVLSGLYLIIILFDIDNQYKNYFKYILLIPIFLAFISIIFSTLINSNLLYNIVNISNQLYYIFTFIITIIITLIYISNIRDTSKQYKLYLDILTILNIILCCLSLYTKTFINIQFIFISILITSITFLLFYILFIKKLTKFYKFNKTDLLGTSKIGMLYFNFEHKLIDYNQSIENLNITNEDIGKNINDFIKSKNLPLELIEYHYNKDISNKQILIQEDWYEFKKNIIIKNNNFLGIIYTYFEITSLKKTKKRIENVTDLMEYNNLKLKKLNEYQINFIKKNHIMVNTDLENLLSFMDLERKYSINEELILNKNIIRLNAISLIYEMNNQELTSNSLSPLHNSTNKKEININTNLNNINLNDFIQSLCEIILNKFKISNYKINYHININFLIKINKLSELSLILIELICNSIENNTYEEIDIEIKIKDNILNLNYIDKNKNLKTFKETSNFILINKILKENKGDLKINEKEEKNKIEILFPVGD